DNLGSVQLQRGAASVNYGSSGIGGVVDLRTRSGFDFGDSGRIEGEIGSNDYRRGAVGLAYSEDRWAVSFETSALSTDNERENDEYERVSFTQRLDYKLNDVLSFELVGRYTDADKEAPGRVSNPSGFAYGETENWLLSPGIRYATDELSMHFFYSRTEFDREGVDDFGSPFPFESSVKSDELSLQVDVSLWEDVLLTGGANYRGDKPQSSNNLGFKTRFEQVGGFVQLIAPVTDSLELRGGIRADHFSEYDDVLTGDLEIIYFIESWQASIFASVANSYSPPTGQDLIFDGDPDTPVDPEESVSYELGLRKNFDEHDLELELVYFRNKIEDLIVFEYDFVNFVFDGFNEEEAVTEGVEAGFTYQLTEKLFLSGSYAYLTAVNETDDERLSKRPRHTIQAAAEIDVTEDFGFGLHATSYIDRVGFGGADLDDFIVVNLVADWRITEDWTAFARADNLFGKDYELSADYPALGRAGYMGVRYSF
ncbi:MAG TPA: TonB-dependent receptor, partial [Opitutales bacterium]|nr:TonB-dependent receptor [Opitutales bacterium]